MCPWHQCLHWHQSLQKAVAGISREQRLCHIGFWVGAVQLTGHHLSDPPGVITVLLHRGSVWQEGWSGGRVLGEVGWGCGQTFTSFCAFMYVSHTSLTSYKMRKKKENDLDKWLSKSVTTIKGNTCVVFTRSQTLANLTCTFWSNPDDDPAR